MSISYENLHVKLEETPPYGFDSIAYVRGTKQGFSKIQPYIDSYVQSTRSSNKIKKLGSQALARYKAMQAQNFEGEKIAFTEDELAKQQQDWARQLGENATIADVGAATAGTLKKMQQVINSAQSSERVKTIEQIEKLLQELETKVNELTNSDLVDLQAVIDASELEGQVVNIENGQLVFSRIKSTLEKLKQITGSNYSLLNNVNREVGALGEALGIFCRNLAEQEISSLVSGSYSNGGHFIQTGSQKSASETGSLTTATADGLVTHTAQVGSNTLRIIEMLSIKTTATTVDENGNWVLKKKGRPEIKIKEISQQQAVWSMLQDIWGKSIRAQNSLYNSLVWERGNTNTVKMVRSSLIAGYFEKFLAGSGGALSGGLGYDSASCLVVNGIPIPIVDIIQEVISVFSDPNAKATSTLSFANLTFSGASNAWVKGANGGRDLTAAMSRSDATKTAIQNSLKITVKLNGNILYSIAKQYM